jgi:recombination protein RecT
MKTTVKERETTQAERQAPTDNLPVTADGKPAHPLTVLKGQLEERANEFAFALPEHIPVARFTRVVLTAVQNNPRLLTCDRASFFNAAMRAAQDGLLPDGREGAIVEYKTKVDGKEKLLAQWMPMYQGILKKVRNSGEFKWMTAQIVYEGDEFDHWIDQDGEHFNHKPAGISERPARAYSAVTTKSGGCFVEVMTLAQVAKVRAASRVKSEYGPWAKWFDEMAKKTAFRRLAKRLPVSSDLDDLIRRDDALYDFEGQRENDEASRSQVSRMTTAAAFDRFASAPMIDHDPETSEVIDEDFGTADQQDDQASAQADPKPAPKEDPISTGRPKPGEVVKPKPQARGNASAIQNADKVIDQDGNVIKDRDGPTTDQAQDNPGDPDVDEANGNDVLTNLRTGSFDPSVGEEVRRWPNGAVPSNPDEYEHYSETKIGDFMKPGDVAPWWKSTDEIKLRKACQVPQSMFDAILKKAQARVAELSKR